MTIKYLTDKETFACYYVQVINTRTGEILYDRMGYYDTLEEVVKTECYLLDDEEYHDIIQKEHIATIIYQCDEYTGKIVNAAAIIVCAEEN